MRKIMNWFKGDELRKNISSLELRLSAMDITTLVRGKVPSINPENKYRTAEPQEYLELLSKKLITTAHEFEESKDPEELADILEVIHAIIRGADMDWETLDGIRLRKIIQLGTFNNRIVMIEKVR